MNATIRGSLLAVVLSSFVAGCSSDSPTPQQTSSPAQAWVVPDTATALAAADRAAFLADLLYYNAHTQANTGGEIRGQIDKIGTVKVATLDGAQETPAVTTSAFGAGILAVNETTGQVSGFIVTSGLVNPTAAHIHQAARGAPGEIIVTLTGGPDVWVVPDNATPLTAPQIAAFQQDQLYFNAHTQANSGGEIRGQIDNSGTAKFASLDGAQETPAVTTTAFGGGVLVVNGTTGGVGGFFVSDGLVNPTAAHVHDAARGTPGDIIVPMTGGPNLWVVPDNAVITGARAMDFAADGLYFNAHTQANSGGEIRGQLDKTGTAKLASLDGAQETPAVTTSAFGGGVLAVDDTTGEVSGFMVTSGLVNPTAAHFHNAVRGTAGPIVVQLSGP